LDEDDSEMSESEEEDEREEETMPERLRRELRINTEGVPMEDWFGAGSDSFDNFQPPAADSAFNAFVANIKDALKVESQPLDRKNKVYRGFKRRIQRRAKKTSRSYLRATLADPQLRPIIRGLSAKPKVTPDEKILVADLPPVPQSYQEVLRRPDAEWWMAAMEHEMNSQIEKGTWRLMKESDLPKGRKAIKSKWVFTYKTTADGFLSRYKARLVATGYSQRKGVDYNETFSPVVRIDSIRVMIAIALAFGLDIEQIDIGTAFLYGDLKEPNYMVQPLGFEQLGPNGERLICELLKTIYGLHQASRAWFQVLKEYLISKGFKCIIADPCIFIRIENGLPIFVLLYVDDVMLISNDKALIETLKTVLKMRFEVKDIGVADWILGLQIERYENGNAIWLGQPRYIMEMFIDAKMWNRLNAQGHEVPIMTKRTPMATSWRHDEASGYLDKERHTHYRSYIMKMSYEAQQTRPDIAYAVNILAQFQQAPTESDWSAMHRLMRYLRGSWDYGLYYRREALHDFMVFAVDSVPEIIPIGYADASYAEDEGRKSRSGHVFLMAGAAVTWRSKKQATVSLSSTEAEYIALSEATMEAIWLRQLLKELHVPTSRSTTIMQDNMSTIAIATNPVHHNRTKHIDVKHHFIREHIDRKDIALVYCPTNDMIADIMTKPLQGAQFTKFVHLMGLRSKADLDGKTMIPASAHSVVFKRVRLDTRGSVEDDKCA
jgi:hypothetical protein